MCDYAAKRRDYIVTHIKLMHSIGPDQYANKDGKHLTLEELGYGHLVIQIKPNKQGLYTCPTCNATFNSKKELTKHTRKIHRTETGRGKQVSYRKLSLL